MRKRTIVIGGLAAAVLIFCLGGAAVLIQTRFLQRLYDDRVLDSRNHYLPCDQWPTEAEVRRVVADHADIIAQIEAVHPGNAGVIVNPLTCPGKADLLIWYASHQDRLAIEAIINSHTFFGVPYRLSNQ